MMRTVTGRATRYTGPWPDGLDTRNLLEALLAAGLPGSATPALGVPSTRVSREPDGREWLLVVTVPGDDGRQWQETIETAIGGG